MHQNPRYTHTLEHFGIFFLAFPFYYKPTNVFSTQTFLLLGKITPLELAFTTAHSCYKLAVTMQRIKLRLECKQITGTKEESNKRKNTNNNNNELSIL